jgi:hypothetical protein
VIGYPFACLNSPESNRRAAAPSTGKGKKVDEKLTLSDLCAKLIRRRAASNP